MVFMALLVKTIVLPDKKILKDTMIVVDTGNSVAYVDGIHFDVLPDEYLLIN